MNRHPASYVVADDDHTAYDESPNPLLDEPDARDRPDPWRPWTCPKCGDDDRHGMPQRCPCGWINYGGDAA